MEEPRVRELMALADAYANALPSLAVARARLESALRQEPVDSHARQTFRPKELPMNPMQEAMRPFSDLSGGEQEPQGGMSELPPLPDPISLGTYYPRGIPEALLAFTADQMRDYARRAILAAAGGRK